MAAARERALTDERCWVMMLGIATRSRTTIGTRLVACTGVVLLACGLLAVRC